MSKHHHHPKDDLQEIIARREAAQETTRELLHEMALIHEKTEAATMQETEEPMQMQPRVSSPLYIAASSDNPPTSLTSLLELQIGCMQSMIALWQEIFFAPWQRMAANR